MISFKEINIGKMVQLRPYKILLSKWKLLFNMFNIPKMWISFNVSPVKLQINLSFVSFYSVEILDPPMCLRRKDNIHRMSVERWIEKQKNKNHSLTKHKKKSFLDSVWSMNRKESDFFLRFRKLMGFYYIFCHVILVKLKWKI